MAVQFSKKLGFRTVVLSRGKDKEELAYQLGAQTYIDSEAMNPVDELKKLGGARVILATAPDSKSISAIINGLGYDGELIIVSAPSEPIQLFPWQLFQGRRSIKGWVARPQRDSGCVELQCEREDRSNDRSISIGTSHPGV